jgi:uncharacterized integral membrane protein (TIGR00698 family)
MADSPSDFTPLPRRPVAANLKSVNPYLNPRVTSFLDSLEGEGVGEFEHFPTHDEGGEKAADGGVIAHTRENIFHFIEWAGTVAPGVVLAGFLAGAGKLLTDWIAVDVLGFSRSPLSAISVAILLGLLFNNLLGLPAVYHKGLKFCLQMVLRLGIAFLGIRLSLMAAAEISLLSIPVVLGCIFAALLLVTHINRAFGLPRRLGSLIAVGTSICGNSAIVATAPGIGADDDEVSYAVACITIFGLVTMFVYPFLANFLFPGDAASAGLFLGTAVHDTAQVTGAGLMFAQQYGSPEALDTAVVTKLVRNLCMVWVIPVMAILYHRSDSVGGIQKTPKWYKLVPFFVVGFVLMTLLRTIGDIGDRPFGFLEVEVWQDTVSLIAYFATWCLTIAMAAVGLGTSFGKLRKLGWKPVTVGFAAAALVGVVSFALIKVVGIVV